MRDTTATPLYRTIAYIYSPRNLTSHIMDNVHLEDSVILTRRIRYDEFLIALYASIGLELAYRAIAWFDSFRTSRAKSKYFAFSERIRARGGRAEEGEEDD